MPDLMVSGLIMQIWLEMSRSLMPLRCATPCASFGSVHGRGRGNGDVPDADHSAPDPLLYVDGPDVFDEKLAGFLAPETFFDSNAVGVNPHHEGMSSKQRHDQRNQQPKEQQMSAEVPPGGTNFQRNCLHVHRVHRAGLGGGRRSGRRASLRQRITISRTSLGRGEMSLPHSGQASSA